MAGARRKLFLPLHKRFYLVVCELHCDRPGFPNARRDDVCQAGFTVRRRRTPVPEELKDEATRLMQRIGKRKAQLALLEQRLCHAPESGGARGTVAAAQAVKTAKAHARAQERLLDLQAQLEEFAETNKLEAVLEGWAPSELENVGAWERIAGDGPEAAAEHVFPLYPLIPDPLQRPHAGRGRALYFGLVPTGSADTDATGAPRFDPRTPYELHCFVRRHDPACPRKRGRRDCCGDLTWSAPGEPFTLASPSDLIGTSNRPVTVELPDIPELLAQAAKLPYGTGAPLKMAGSSLPIDVEDGKVKKGTPGIPQICSFAIPLITIVAFFVFRLFLPVVVLLFGLWPLLRLKFCIPPTLDLGLDMSAQLQLSKGGVDLDTHASAALWRQDIRDKLNANLGGFGTDERSGDKLVADMPSLNQLVPFVMEQQRAPDDPIFGPPPAPPAGALPSPNALLAPLIWEDELPCPISRRSRRPSHDRFAGKRVARSRLELPGRARRARPRAAAGRGPREGASVDPGDPRHRAGRADHAPGLRLRPAALPDGAQQRGDAGADPQRRRGRPHALGAAHPRRRPSTSCRATTRRSSSSRSRTPTCSTAVPTTSSTRFYLL